MTNEIIWQIQSDPNQLRQAAETTYSAEQKPASIVIPAKAGIHRSQRLMDSGSPLRSGRNDGFGQCTPLFRRALEHVRTGLNRRDIIVIASRRLRRRGDPGPMLRGGPGLLRTPAFAGVLAMTNEII